MFKRIETIRTELPLNWASAPRNAAALSRGRAAARRMAETAALSVQETEDKLVELARKDSIRLYLVEGQAGSPVGLFLAEGAEQDFPKVRSIIEHARENGLLAGETAF